MAHYYLFPASDSDFDFVYELKKVAYKEYIEQTWGWDDEFQLKFHKENFSSRNTHIIKAGDQQIGSVDIKESEANIFISGLYILPSFQSKGIGSSIIKNLIEEAVLKKKRLELEVLRVNTKALKLYERLGFTKAEGDETKFFMYK
ncbi:MAG TPA: GNAT family N-acetyltransferase [Segetibacter sp.]|nr:GNAT family N-acetyltransferase [Segetibacter sp.]